MSLLRWIQSCSIRVSFCHVTPSSESSGSWWDLKKRWHGSGGGEFMSAMLTGNAFRGEVKDLPVFGSKTSSAAFPLTISHLQGIYNQVWGKKQVHRRLQWKVAGGAREIADQCTLESPEQTSSILHRSRRKNSDINSSSSSQGHRWGQVL